MSFSTYDILTEFVDSARHVDAAQLEFQWHAKAAAEREHQLSLRYPARAKHAVDVPAQRERARDTARRQNRRRRPYLRALKSRRWAEIKASDPARYQATLATYRARNAKCRAARKMRAA